jgi:hypothetical protein
MRRSRVGTASGARLFLLSAAFLFGTLAFALAGIVERL